jgi:hypothetical protein
MANSRIVSTNFWRDTYITNLDPTEKLLFLYFLTNPQTNLAGIYEIDLRLVAFDTGIDESMVKKILERFCDDRKIYYENGWLILCNFIKYQKLNANMKKGVRNIIDSLPDWLQKKITLTNNRGIMQLKLKPLPNGSKPLPNGSDNIIKLNINKIKSNKNRKSVEKPPDIIGSLFYQAIKALGLPVTNHNTIKAKIEALKREIPEIKAISYLEFIRDKYLSLEIDFKPQINTALDIYTKRVQIENAIRQASKEQSNQGVRL